MGEDGGLLAAANFGEEVGLLAAANFGDGGLTAASFGEAGGLIELLLVGWHDWRRKMLLPPLPEVGEVSPSRFEGDNDEIVGSDWRRSSDMPRGDAGGFSLGSVEVIDGER